MIRRLWMSLATVVLLSLTGSLVPAGANTITHDACPGLTATTSVFKQVGPSDVQGDVLENLGFDGLGSMFDGLGSVWVSNATKARVERYDSLGTLREFFKLAAPGALTLGLDGLMYANTGAAAAGAVLRTGAAGVVRFDPAKPVADPTAHASVFASGMNMANGGIFDTAGNYYTSNDFDSELTKIRPDGTFDTAWSMQADVWGTNGLVAVGGELLAAITFDQRSPIERIPLGSPAAHSTLVQTTFGVASLQPAVYAQPDSDAPLVGLKGLDDMTLGPDGRLWVVANGTGELLRVDIATREVCLVTGGLRSPSSVRFARSFGAYSDSSDVFITEFSGAIRRVSITTA